MNSIRLLSICLFGNLLLSTSPMRADEKSDEAIIAEREAAFSKSMEKCVLTGTFTIDVKDDGDPLKAESYEIEDLLSSEPLTATLGDPLKPESYEIESVTKATDNLWIFMTRIKYGKLDTKLPITVPMEWAGDTPMVTLTNASLPGLGEGFSARVLFYDGRYAGTWQHGPVGGHMFGKIARQKEVQK